MKKRVLGLLVCLLITVFMAGSALGTENDIITISISDQAEKFVAENFPPDGLKRIIGKENFDDVLQLLSLREEQSFPDCAVKNSLDAMEIQGSKVYTLTKEGYQNVVLYIHGGAWVFDISVDHVTFCDELATRLNAKVYMPLYPLAPESNSEATYEVIENLYRDIMMEGKNLYIMGDSAGGNITLGLMYTIKKDNLKKPDKMILISPCSDMTFSNPDMIALNKTDPQLDTYGCSKSAVLWAGEENLQTPKNSALYADVTGYPDSLIFQGTNDILYPDTLLLYQKMKDAGVNIKLVIGEGLWHVFPIDQIPEREQSLNLIVEFCEE